jgi:hypothetical protein
MKRHHFQWAVLWLFHVKPAKERTFRRIYGRGGEWTRLFAKDPNYIGTDLLYHSTSTRCYLTMDRWATREAYHNFKKRHRKEFVALDTRCEVLTVREIKIGEFSSASGVFLIPSERYAEKSLKRRHQKRAG